MVCFSRKYVAAILPDISFQARILAELFHILLDIRLHLKSVLHSWFSGDTVATPKM
jgi:hypothetical protein